MKTVIHFVEWTKASSKMFSLLVIRGKLIRPTVWCHFTAISLAKILKSGGAKYLRMTSSWNSHPLPGQVCKLIQPLRRFFSTSHSWRRTYPITWGNSCTCGAGDTHRNVSCSIVPRCQASKRWVNKMWYRSIRMYGAVKMNEVELCVSAMDKSQKHNAQHQKLLSKWCIQCCAVSIKFRPVEQYYIVLTDLNLCSESRGIISTKFRVVVTSRVARRERRMRNQAAMLRELQQYLCCAVAQRISSGASMASS